jgi:hypothetical protein
VQGETPSPPASRPLQRQQSPVPSAALAGPADRGTHWRSAVPRRKLGVRGSFCLAHSSRKEPRDVRERLPPALAPRFNLGAIVDLLRLASHPSPSQHGVALAVWGDLRLRRTNQLLE